MPLRQRAYKRSLGINYVHMIDQVTGMVSFRGVIADWCIKGINNYRTQGNDQEMDFPKGVNARFISLKCCLPKGMPMMVMQNKIPNNRWVRAIQKPPHNSQIIFMMVDKHPVLDDVSVIFTPKGARPTIANLKHWMPKGIPTIVKQRIKPPIIYSKNIKIPPRIIQIILPKKFIVFFNLR